MKTDIKKASSLWDNVGIYAKEHLSRYIAMIYHLIEEEKKRFDIIIAAGDSGIGMVGITGMIFTELNVEFPQVLSLPIYRFLPGSDEKASNRFDNSHLIPPLRKQLRGLGNIKRMLFVDDEIGDGNTVEIALELILEASKKEGIRFDRPICTIVAEDQGFDPGRIKLEVKIDFQPYTSEIKGLNNVITYHIPYKFYSPIRKLYSDKELESKALVNILLGLPLKDFNSGKPRFSYKYNNIIKEKISNFKQIQGEYRKFLKEEIEKSIKTFKKGKIHLSLERTDT